MNRRMDSFRGIVIIGQLVLLAGVVPASAPAEVIVVGSGVDDPGLTIRSQSATGVELRYAMTEFALDPLTIDGGIR